MREEQHGKYYGVGMTVGPRNNKVIVIAPFFGTPAFRAGIHPGDIIIAVDGKSADNLSTSDVADMLKGPKGTTVRITMLREGSEKPLEFAVIRDEIPRSSVDLHFLIRPGIGYMHVTNFQETTEHEVAQALDEFGDIKGLVLDLRQNPGGLLNEGVGVADKFLKKGQVIVSHHGRASSEKRYYATAGRLIQRDYSSISLYDYYYNHEGEDGGPNREVKLTDGGRTVYGGGGITPDVKIPPVKSTHLQESLLQHYAFFNFAKHYTVSRHPGKDIVVDDALLLEFRKYLDENKVPFTEPELSEVVDWVKANIKAE